jgi:hypothetical protein
MFGFRRKTRELIDDLIVDFRSLRDEVERRVDSEIRLRQQTETRMDRRITDLGKLKGQMDDLMKAVDTLDIGRQRHHAEIGKIDADARESFKQANQRMYDIEKQVAGLVTRESMADDPNDGRGFPYYEVPVKTPVKPPCLVDADEHAALMAVLVALETWMGAGIDDPHAVNFCAMKQAMKHARSLIETPDTQPTPQPSP